MKELLVAGDSNEKQDRRTNFLFVASRASSHHLVYHRDLPLLLTLSMEIKEHSLALDLGKSPRGLRSRLLSVRFFAPLTIIGFPFSVLQPGRSLTIPSFRCKILHLILCRSKSDW